MKTAIIIVLICLIIIWFFVSPIGEEALKQKIKRLCLRYFLWYGTNADGIKTTGLILYERGIGGVRIKFEPDEDDDKDED